MSNKDLKNFGNDYIKRDLKRLKSLKSLKNDIENLYKISKGRAQESLECAVCASPLGDLITEAIIEGEHVAFYKKYLGIQEPRMSAKDGARVIFGFIKSKMVFVPILVYRASEERGAYKINNKTFFFKSSDLIKIINEKLKYSL